MRGVKITLYLIVNAVLVSAWLRCLMFCFNAPSTLLNLAGLFGLLFAPILCWANLRILERWLN